MKPAAAKARNEAKKRKCDKFYFFLGKLLFCFLVISLEFKKKNNYFLGSLSYHGDKII
jgi:hypothetical protein